MLKVSDLRVSYGAIKAIQGISFDVKEGEIISLIGSNGAGKTTTLQSLSNIIQKESGSVFFYDKDITKVSSDEIVKMGLVHVPEGRRVFSNMTVKENLDIGAYTRKDKDGIRKDRDRVFELFPRLAERMKQYAGTLSGGEQQMLAIGRGLMARPKLLLLDEPSMGLAPILVDEIFSIVKSINREGVTILLVEQNAFKALALANRGYILETGKIIKTGTGEELVNDPAVKSAYLGG
ncbi:MAG: ABC transporter ATP-binding protein [Spirochaetes bacterium]|uniref:ABC transporter ATP-binding protein n=1 Tax=Candidatus Gallitreponema excrementavium TaxID=2840840 RepID=A0A9D9N2C3_9SPIR|nr:ABC transporter ATP-binding protein [Candidatus Gallitreponema excrementavium]